MPGLSATDVLRIWETARGRRTTEQALVLLASGYPELDPGQLPGLSIGERDRLLLDLYERAVGPRLEAYAECPRCQERLEFAVNTAEIRATAPAIDGSGESRLTRGELDIVFRLPNSDDLFALADYPDVASARRGLLDRCLIRVSRLGAPVSPPELPEAVIVDLGRAMLERDPQVEVLLDLRCPTCEHQWQALLEIADFLWMEVTTRAKRLLREVDCLARAYGWREADILALSPARRRAYLELVEA